MYIYRNIARYAVVRLRRKYGGNRLHSYICITCGHQFAASEEPPERCPICEDDRQFVNPRGQSWTTLDELAREHRNVFRPLEQGLTGIGTEPGFRHRSAGAACEGTQRQRVVGLRQPH